MGMWEEWEKAEKINKERLERIRKEEEKKVRTENNIGCAALIFILIFTILAFMFPKFFLS